MPVGGEPAQTQGTWELLGDQPTDPSKIRCPEFHDGECTDPAQQQNLRQYLPGSAGHAQLGVAASGRAIYASGGIGTDGRASSATVALDAGGWSQRADLPTPRTGMAVATGQNGHIYAVGGQTGGMPAIDWDLPSSTFEIYDPAADTWYSRFVEFQPPPMPTARVYAAAAVDNDGVLYVLGGDTCGLTMVTRACPNGQFRSTYLSTVEAYDPRTGNWTTRAPLPTPRSGLAAVRGKDGRIYAIGGFGEVGDQVKALAVVEAYDPSTNTWTAAPPMGTPRAMLAATVGSDGRIYAIGGSETPAQSLLGPAGLNTVEVFDPVGLRWSALPPLLYPVANLGAATGADGRIYAIGGQHGLSGYNRVQGYNP